MDEYKNIGRGATDLASGRMLSPGEIVDAEALELGTEGDTGHDQRLIDEGVLLYLGPERQPPRLTGEALTARAAELEIEGRSTMNADELRAAIAVAENDEAAPDAEEVPS